MGTAATKKDPNAPQPTPLEKLLTDAGPLRTDGSDKFFGMENVSFQPCPGECETDIAVYSLAIPGKAQSLRESSALLTSPGLVTVTLYFNAYITRYLFGNR